MAKIMEMTRAAPAIQRVIKNNSDFSLPIEAKKASAVSSGDGIIAAV